MPRTRKEVVELINDPVCHLVMQRDGVRPTDLFNMMRTVHPIVRGEPASGEVPDEPDPCPDGVERRKAPR